MEAAHACEDADLRRLANQVDELIVDCHSDASENWQEIDLVDGPRTCACACSDQGTARGLHLRLQ